MRAWLLACAALLATPLVTGAASVAGPPPAPRAVTVLAGPGAPAGTRWTAWAVGRGEGQAVHLALRDAHGRIRWSSVRPDAYDPALTPVPGWTARGRPVVLLTLSYGAAAQTAELLALALDGRPRILARRDAAAVELRTAPGAPVLVLRQAPGSEPQTECLRWDGPASRLRSAPCR